MTISPVELASELTDGPDQSLTVTLTAKQWADILAALDMASMEDGMSSWHKSWLAVLDNLCPKLMKHLPC